MKFKFRFSSSLILAAFFIVAVNPGSHAATNTITTKLQVQKAIKNMNLLMAESDKKLADLDDAYQVCLDKFDAEHPDNRQIRDRYTYCDSQYPRSDYEKVSMENADLQDQTMYGILAANRILKAKANFEAEFILAINFEFAWKSFELMAKKQTWEVQANQLAEVAKAQNLYDEGYWIAQKYDSKKAKAYLVKVKMKADFATAKPYLLLLRKAAFMKS